MPGCNKEFASHWLPFGPQTVPVFVALFLQIESFGVLVQNYKLSISNS
jgi:hypothetical protein